MDTGIGAIIRPSDIRGFQVIRGDGCPTIAALGTTIRLDGDGAQAGPRAGLRSESYTAILGISFRHVRYFATATTVQ
jgi:hypothetical protein